MTSSASAFWDKVDGVLVVNLDARPDRWASTQAQLAGVVPADKLHRMPATAGIALPGYAAPPWFRGRRRDKTWAGRAGCALSHRAAIAYARRVGWRRVLILEDDVKLAASLPGVLAALPGVIADSRCDVCYLGYTDPVSPSRDLAPLPDGHRLYQVSGCSTTHAYLLSDTTYDWLLSKLPEPADIWPWIARHRAIDRWYYRNLARRFTVCVVSPAIVDQEGGFSDITQREHEKVHATRVPSSHTGPLRFSVLGRLRQLQFALAEPRDALRGWIKRVRGF